ncbi:MAG TPA: polymer-forming cytoskeletal protein [Thermoanaerobaculia bacterium]|nr:polymer-forming cytoskeletal protein [Thermoanaerobaculia bacterium]
MRQLADRLSMPLWSRAVLLALALLFAVAPMSNAVKAQPTPPPAPEVEAPPAEPLSEEVRDEVLERLDRTLDEVEERIEEDADDADDVREEVLRERRERVREIREQVHRRLRERSERSDNKVAFGSSITVPEGEVARDVVAIGGHVDVEGDVEGDVVAVGGPVSINGKVTGDVVAVGAGVELGDDAEVLGEVTSVGGRVNRAEGAEVVGRINEVALGPSFSWDVGDTDINWWDWDDHRHFSPFGSGWFGFGLSLIGIVVLLLLALLVRLVAGGTVERVRAKAVEAPWMCALVGLAIELFFVPVLIVVAVILAISIIGIPLLLLIPFVVLAFLLALVVGYTGVAQAVGDSIGRRFGRPATSPYLSVFFGVVLIQFIHIIAEFFDSFSGFLFFFALMFGIVGFLVRFAAWTVGIGAVFLIAVRRSGQVAMVVPPPPPADYPPSGAYLPPEPPPPPSGWSSRPIGDTDSE